MTTPDSRTVWYVRTGPCWCRGRPGADGSSDVLTWRRRQAQVVGLDANLLIATETVPADVAAEIRPALDRHRWIVVVQPHCPQVPWSPSVGTVVEVASLVAVDVRLDVCADAEPETLALALTSLFHARSPRIALAT